MILSFLLPCFLQIGIFSQNNPNYRIYLYFEQPDTTKTEFQLFQTKVQKAPYISVRDSLLTLRLKNIIDGNYSQNKLTLDPIGNISGFDLKKFDKYGVLDFVDFQKTKNEIQTKNFDFTYNMIRGKADIGYKLINNKDFDLKFGMNISLDYFQLKKLQDIKIFGNPVVLDRDRYSDNNQFFIRYRFENWEMLSKYELQIFNQHEHKFNEDKISIVIAYDF